MKDTPSARTKRFFEAGGYEVASCEKVNVYAGPPHMRCETCGKNKLGMKRDLYNIADHVAFHPDKPEVLLIQSTSSGNHSARRNKILANAVAKQWVRFSNRCILVVSWSKKAKKKMDGKRSNVKEWVERIDFITLQDFL